VENIVVIYESKYGATKQYAQWIADDLECDLVSASETNPDAIMKYDTIIFGGGLYASGISGISLITKNFEKLKEKNLIVFTVGLADPSQKEQFKPILDKNFEADMLEKIAIFHLRGSIDYKKLGIIHQSMMAMLKAIIKRKGEKMTNEDKQFFESYGKKVDFKDRLSIKPLLSYVKNEF